MIRNGDYIVIQGWMRELDLTDKQEKVYALIWGYSRDGHGVWRGTAAELAMWVGCSERHAKRIIHELEDRGLIAHDVIAWSNGKVGGTRSEFWAVLPDDAAAPVKGGKKKVAWRERKSARPRGGRDMDVPRGRDMDVPRGRDMDVPTPMEDYQGIHRLSCGGGKYNARSRARKIAAENGGATTTTTTTTGNLFESVQDLSGLAPGSVAPLELPFRDDPDAPVFDAAWSMLLRQPAWQGKTPDQLNVQLETFAWTHDPLVCAYACRVAVEKQWDTIKSPGAIADKDGDRFDYFCETVRLEQQRRRAAE